MRANVTRLQRLSEIQKVPFLLLSHIILETREALIQKVQNAIVGTPVNILFIIGGTGAGKSTTLCFLRGDEMIQVKENFCYRAKKDQSSLIGEDIATSCTFLPTIEKIKDWFIVDFPGFEDTNGPLVSLGIEFALKALIKRYYPKILVLQSITNTAIGKGLGQTLNRLLINKEDCLLGITKYLKDPDFIEINCIEEHQRKKLSTSSQEELKLRQALLKVSEEELELKGALEYATEDELTEVSINEIHRELAELQLTKKEIQLKLNKTFYDFELNLPETRQKTERKVNIKEKETILVEQIGIKNIFRFDNLIDFQLVLLCFKTLSELKSTRPSLENQLKAENERVIRDCFESDLKYQIYHLFDRERIHYNFKNFKKSVLETSFISTIFSETYLEIGMLFHLPEMDQNIVNELDKEIISNYVNKIIEYIICSVDIDLIKKTFNEFKDQISGEILEKYQRKILQLQEYILTLHGGERPRGF